MNIYDENNYCFIEIYNRFTAPTASQKHITASQKHITPKYWDMYFTEAHKGLLLK